MASGATFESLLVPNYVQLATESVSPTASEYRLTWQTLAVATKYRLTLMSHPTMSYHMSHPGHHAPLWSHKPYHLQDPRTPQTRMLQILIQTIWTLGNFPLQVDLEGNDVVFHALMTMLLNSPSSHLDWAIDYLIITVSCNTDLVCYVHF